MPLRLPRLLAGALFALLSLLVPRLVHAQLVITNKTTFVRLDNQGRETQSEHQRRGLQPFGINLQDCRDNQRLRLAITVSDVTPGDVIEAWATDQGADCSDSNQRISPVAKCYQIRSVNIPALANTTAEISVREAIAGLPGQQQLDADGCRRAQAKMSVSVQIMLFRGGTTGTAAGKDTLELPVKTQGPVPLAGVRVQPGNGNLGISFQNVGEAGVEDLTKVYAFCDREPKPAGGSGATEEIVCDDAGTVTDDSGDVVDAGDVDANCRTVTTPGSGAGSIPTPGPGFADNGVACKNAAFTAEDGSRITPDAKFQATYACGEAGGTTATSISAAPIDNNTIVAIAIAAEDSFGNVGELSDPLCQFGEETGDFWNRYRQAGGESGGGFCAIGPDGMPAASFAALGVAIVVGMSIVRRKKGSR
ncbi:MAG: hypothetical protein KF819_26920 [Labilithrix sp.]|nr:hypothetical protein [Labilithrix sp.]